MNHKLLREPGDALSWWKEGDAGRRNGKFELKTKFPKYYFFNPFNCKKNFRLWNISSTSWSNPHSLSNSPQSLHSSKNDKWIGKFNVSVNISHQKESWVVVRPWMFKTAAWQLLQMSSHFTGKIPWLLSTLHNHSLLSCSRNSRLFVKSYLQERRGRQNVFGKQHWSLEDKANILLRPWCTVAHTTRLVIFAL